MDKIKVNVLIYINRFMGYVQMCYLCAKIKY